MHMSWQGVDSIVLFKLFVKMILYFIHRPNFAYASSEQTALQLFNCCVINDSP